MGLQGAFYEDFALTLGYTMCMIIMIILYWIASHFNPFWFLILMVIGTMTSFIFAVIIHLKHTGYFSKVAIDPLSSPDVFKMFVASIPYESIR